MIEIDFSELYGEMFELENFNDGIINDLQFEVAQRVYEEWVKVARETLHSSRAEYIRSINIDMDPSTGQVSLVLSGTLANMIEDGVSAYDMKPILLGSKNAKVDKKGHTYVTIPFVFGTPSSTTFYNTLPRSIYDIVRKYKANADRLKASDIPSKFSFPQHRPAPSSGFSSYQHKSPIYEGMMKNDKGIGKYNTFRRISDKTDSSAFIHPGISAYNLADKAISRASLDNYIDQLVNEFLND